MKNILKIYISFIAILFFCVLSLNSFISVKAETKYEPETNILLLAETVATEQYAQVSQSFSSNNNSEGYTEGKTVTIIFTVEYDKELPSDFSTPTYNEFKITSNDLICDNCSIDNVVISNINGKKCTYALTIKLKDPGDAVITSARFPETVQTTLKVIKKASIFSIIIDVLNNGTMIGIVITLGITAIGKAAVKIFIFGTNYKSHFATIDDQKSFEAAIREDLRNNKTEIQDSILKICLREINRETRPLQDVQSMTNSIQRDREILNVRLDSVDQKYNEIRKMSENISKLEQTVNRLQYSDSTSDNRRSGK